MPKADGQWKKFSFTKTMCEQLKEIAEEKGISETEVLESAFQTYYKQDVLPEHIIEARLNQVQHQMNMIDNKIETFSGLMYSIMPYIFGCLPPLPKNEINARGEKFNPAIMKGNDIFTKLVIQYRKEMKAHKISFVQSVWGDMQESIEYTNTDDEGEVVERSSGN